MGKPYDDEEEDDYTIKEAKQNILRAMSKEDPLSDRYMVLSQRLTEITECERNETQTEQAIASKWSWIVPTVVQSVSTAVGTGVNTFMSYKMNRRTVRDVLDYEDRGNILTTKASGFMKNPK